MSLETALRLSIAALVLSLASLALVMASFIFHLQIPAGPFRLAMGLSYLWPAAAFAVVWFRKKLGLG